MKQIKVSTKSGKIVEFLDLEQTKKQYSAYFKAPPSDKAIIQFLTVKTSYLKYEIVDL